MNTHATRRLEVGPVLAVVAGVAFGTASAAEPELTPAMAGTACQDERGGTTDDPELTPELRQKLFALSPDCVPRSASCTPVTHATADATLRQVMQEILSEYQALPRPSRPTIRTRRRQRKRLANHRIPWAGCCVLPPRQGHQRVPGRAAGDERHGGRCRAATRGRQRRRATMAEAASRLGEIAGGWRRLSPVFPRRPGVSPLLLPVAQNE